MKSPEGGGGNVSREIGWGVCGTFPEILNLFQTKICDFPYRISDLVKNLIPYFRSSLRGRRSKGKGKGIRARDHARGRREEGNACKEAIVFAIPPTN